MIPSSSRRVLPFAHRVMVVLFALVLCAGCDRASWKAAEALNVAESGDLAQAIKLMQEAVEQAPENGKLRLKLARLLAENGEGELAINQCDIYLEKFPDDLSAYQVRAECNLFIGRYKKALKDIKKSVSDHVSRNSFELNSLAYHRALANTELSTAAENIRKAIEIREKEYWGASLVGVPLRVRALVAAGLLARHVDEHGTALVEFDAEIDQVESTIELLNERIELLDVESDDDDQLSAEDKSRLETFELTREMQSRSLMALLTVRALINEDLQNTVMVDADRIRLKEMGYELNEVADGFPFARHSLYILPAWSAYLDTRGFVLAKESWGQDSADPDDTTIKANQVKYQLAIADMNAAILAAKVQLKAIDSPLYNSPDITIRQPLGAEPSANLCVERDRRGIKRTLAVLLYHRMKLNKSAGLDVEAGVDEQSIIDLGFEPNCNLF